MPANYLILLTIVPAVVLIVQDFRSREVSLIWLVAFGLSVIFISFNGSELSVVFQNIILNMLLICYLALGVLVYLWAKTRKLTNPLKNYLGLGDLVFIIFLTPLWGIREFLFFLIFSLVATLAFYGIRSVFTDNKSNIPLIGTLGVAYCLYIIFNLFR